MVVALVSVVVVVTFCLVNHYWASPAPALEPIAVRVEELSRPRP
jgi:hypothetical protein